MGYKPLTRSLGPWTIYPSVNWQLYGNSRIDLFPWETMGFPYLFIEISWRTTRFCLTGFVMVCLKTGYGNTPEYHHPSSISHHLHIQWPKQKIRYIYIYVPFSPLNSVCYISQNIAPYVPAKTTVVFGEKSPWKSALWLVKHPYVCWFNPIRLPFWLVHSHYPLVYKNLMGKSPCYLAG